MKIQKVNIIDAISQMAKYIAKETNKKVPYYWFDNDDHNFYVISSIDLIRQRVWFDCDRDSMWFDNETEIFIIEVDE